jgi:glycosyltransferase involved in cell wall biosynthesis
MLSASVPKAFERSPSSRLLLVGKGSVQARDLLIARSSLLSGRIHATGPLEPLEISAHLSACDLAVQPYPDGICTRHSSAMTVLAHGVPMVTTEGRFTEDLWRASDAVTLVRAGDGAAMASAVERLLGDTSERARHRQRALGLYRERFDLRHTVAALLGSSA